MVVFMKRMPGWVLLVGGFAIGVVSVMLILRGSEALASPAWQESIAWQGWAGAFVGTFFTGIVAWFVLRATLAADAARMRDQLQAERNAAVDQKRVEAWSALVALARGYFRFPVDRDELGTLEQQATAAFFTWSLYMPAAKQDLVDGVDAALSGVIGSARHQVSAPREDASVTHLRSEKDDLIANMVSYGNALHRHEADSTEAEAWFLARAAERPWHRERPTRIKPVVPDL